MREMRLGRFSNLSGLGASKKFSVDVPVQRRSVKTRCQMACTLIYKFGIEKNIGLGPNPMTWNFFFLAGEANLFFYTYGKI